MNTAKQICELYFQVFESDSEHCDAPSRGDAEHATGGAGVRGTACAGWGADPKEMETQRGTGRAPGFRGAGRTLNARTHAQARCRVCCQSHRNARPGGPDYPVIFLAAASDPERRPGHGPRH